MDIRMSAINSIQSIDQWLKVLAGNLTGSNVIGYRQQRVEFADVLSKHVAAGSPASGRESTVNPIDLPAGGMQIKATKTDFSQGSLQSTGQAADLAITGDGFFILSRVRNPTRMSDLVFTRNGSFHFDFFQAPTPEGLGAGATKGEYRLINQDGLFVMGFKSEDPNAYEKNVVDNLPGRPVPPREFSAFKAGGDPGVAADSLSNLPPIGLDLPKGGSIPKAYTFEPIAIPFQNDPNPIGGVPKSVNERFNPSFNSSGWVQIDSDAPRADAADPNKKLVMFVALAKFADPSGLTKLKGGSEFGWNNNVGQTFLGVAGQGNGPVGKSNTLNPGSLETSNSSVNTTLPELTIAQKSFTANVKIVQVGNNLIDDVNNLVR